MLPGYLPLMGQRNCTDNLQPHTLGGGQLLLNMTIRATLPPLYSAPNYTSLNHASEALMSLLQ